MCQGVKSLERLMTISTIERDLVSKAAACGLRVDGRAFDDIRDISFEFSTKTRGQVCISLGGTR